MNHMAGERPLGLIREPRGLQSNLTPRDLATETARKLFPNFNPETSSELLEKLEKTLNFGAILSLSGLEGNEKTQALKSLGEQVFGENDPILNKFPSAFSAARLSLLTIQAPEVVVTDSIAEHTEESLAQKFRKDCTTAGYNIFQLVDVQMTRETERLVLSKKPVFWASADSFRPIDTYISRNTNKTEAVEERMKILQRMQQGDRVSEDDPRRYRVGNSIVVLADGKDNHTFLIIYGSISAELAGSWKGGRTNFENSVVFEFGGKDAIDRFISEIDVSARAYEDGTEHNYKIICEAMNGVFPKEAMGFTKSHMFHRQEIQDIVDLRKNK